MLILIMLAYPCNTFGKQQHKQSLISISQTNIAPDVFYKKVVVYLKGGDVLTGLLVGVENDLFIIRAGKKNEKVPLNNITKITIETERKLGQHLSCGMILGTYLGNAIFNRAENQPIAYMKKIESGWEIFFQNAMFVSLGGGLGYLFSMIAEREEKKFNFEGSDQKRQDEWRRFLKYMSQERSRKRLHISIQGGSVFTNVSRKYSGILENSGFWILLYQPQKISYGWDYGMNPASNFNLLRKLQLSISLKPQIEFGVALISLGEPFLHGENRESWVNQSLSTNGIYAVGIYKFFISEIPKGFSWNVGAGAGAAKVDFSLEHIEYFGYPIYDEVVVTSHSIKETRFSTVFFTELNFYLYNSLSLGLVADYVFVPSENAPGIPELNIPEQRLRLGNGSIGFNFSFHF